MSDRILWQIEGRHFSAGLETGVGHTVVKAAPILRRYRGWRIDYVLEDCRKKRRKMRRVP